jgi:hypothetical protein
MIEIKNVNAERGERSRQAKDACIYRISSLVGLLNHSSLSCIPFGWKFSLELLSPIKYDPHMTHQHLEMTSIHYELIPIDHVGYRWQPHQ